MLVRSNSRISGNTSEESAQVNFRQPFTDRGGNGAFMRRVRVAVNEAHGDGLDALRGNAGDCLSERVPVERADYLTAVVEPLRHFEAPAPAYQRSGTLLIHVVKAHQPEPAYFEQVAKALGCNQPGARAASLDDRVCRDGRAMDQFFDAVAGYAGLCKHVANSAENRLGVIPAG